MNHQRGVSIVELLVSMALGLVILTAMGYIYSGTRQSYRQQDNLARIQENGRYALELLGQEIRMAGYLGCPNMGETPPVMRASNAVIGSLGLAAGVTRPVVGTLADSGIAAGNTNSVTATQLANTDLLVIHRASTAMFPLTAAMVGKAGNIQVGGSPAGLENAHNDVLVISDCADVDIFCASTVAPAVPNGAAATLSHAVACNGSGDLSKAYGTNAMVMGMESTIYFLRNNAAGAPALYRKRWAPNEGNLGGVEELVDNVEDMRVTFGEDTDNDGSVNLYRQAGAVGDWGRVRSVRVSLLLRSPEAGVATQVQTYVWDSDNDGQLDDTVLAGDTRLRYVYTTTVAIRNRAMGGM